MANPTSFTPEGHTTRTQPEKCSMENRKIQYLSICNTCPGKPGTEWSKRSTEKRNGGRKGLGSWGLVSATVQVASCLLTAGPFVFCQLAMPSKSLPGQRCSWVLAAFAAAFWVAQLFNEVIQFWPCADQVRAHTYR